MQSHPPLDQGVRLTPLFLRNAVVIHPEIPVVVHPEIPVQAFLTHTHLDLSEVSKPGFLVQHS